MNTELNKLMNQVKTIKEQRDFYRTRCMELINEQNTVPKKKYDEVKNELNYLKVAFNKLKDYCEELEAERKVLITKHDRLAYDYNRLAEEHMQTEYDLKKAENNADALYLANRILIETDFN